MMSSFDTLFAAALLASLTTAQSGPVQDWRMPFRRPVQNIAAPPFWPALTRMKAVAEGAGRDRVELVDGVAICDHPEWKKARAELDQHRFDPGYLSLILRDSGSVEDRAVAFYGSFHVPDPGTVFALIEHIPGEPVPALREAAYNAALPYLAHHLPAKNPGDVEAWRTMKVGPAGKKPPRPGDFSYSFDPTPFVALLDAGDWRDQVQVLTFLKECLLARPALHELYLERTRERLPALLTADRAFVRGTAREFLTTIDPKHRPAPAAEAPAAEVGAWLEAIVYDVFPPIRRMSPGLFHLFASDDLDRIVETGKRVLEEGSLGDPAGGRYAGKTGGFYRGLRIARLPEPLDKLGLEIGWVVTSINGVPVATCNDVLNTLNRSLPRLRRFFVEYVVDDTAHAIEFVRR